MRNIKSKTPAIRTPLAPKATSAENIAANAVADTAGETSRPAENQLSNGHLGQFGNERLTGESSLGGFVANGSQSSAADHSPQQLRMQALAGQVQITGSQPKSVKVGTDRVQPLIGSEETKEATISLINKAQHSLYITTHAVDDPDYISAITDAADRGVSVHIAVSDPAYAGYSKKRQRGIRERLEKLGDNPRVAVHDFPNDRLQTGTSAFIPELHTKLVIADGGHAYIGDNNLKFHGDSLGAGVILHGPSAKQLSRFFLEIWSSSGGTVERRPFYRLTDNPDIQILNSRVSDRDIKATLIQDIANARESIFIMQYAFSDPEVISALIDKKAQDPDTKIEVLLGRKHATVGSVRLPLNLHAYRELTKAGIDARFTNEERFVHGKLSVIDDVTHLGSADLTYRALEGNLETNARIKSSEVSDHFVEQLGGWHKSGETPTLTARDNLEINLGNRLEKSVYKLFSLGHRVWQGKRALHFSPAMAKKLARSMGQFLERQFKTEKYEPVDLDARRSFSDMDQEIDLHFNVLTQKNLSKPTDGVFMVAGHTLKRAQLINRLGPQMCYNGDIGPGVYLADDAVLANEYSKIHGAGGRQELIVYQGDIDAPFRLPRQREEYEAWRQEQPNTIKRNLWQQLPDFCREKGYDSVIMEHFEGHDRNYIMVLDRSKVRAVRHYSVTEKKTAGWGKVIKESVGKVFKPKRVESERPLTMGLSGAVKVEPADGTPGDWSFRFDEAAKEAYQGSAMETMQQRRGLVDTDKLNSEIGDLDKHSICQISSASGRDIALLRLIKGYNTTRYRGLFDNIYDRLKDKNVAEMALYPERPEDEYRAGTFKAAVDAACAHRQNTGGPDTLYIEVRPERVDFLKEQGFEVAGLPFEANAWEGKWVPLVYDLQQHDPQ